MNNTSTPAAHPIPDQSPHRLRGGKGSGRLLHRTFIIAFLLVSGGLIISGAVELVFLYHESVESLGALQEEMAEGAAFKIRHYVQDLEKTLQATTQGPDLATAGLTDALQFPLQKLLQSTLAVTTVVVLDATGHEQFKVSRIQMPRQEALGQSTLPEAFAGVQ